MAEFIFTPGQREEALTWVKENCPELHDFLTILHLNETQQAFLQDMVVDMFLKLKQVTFPIKKNEFIFGIEYKNREDVIEGKEQVNLTLQNPHRKDEYDMFSHQVAVELLNRLKG